MVFVASLRGSAPERCQRIHWSNDDVRSRRADGRQILTSQADQLVHRVYGQLIESQYWACERLRAYQERQLDHLLRHARANSPFYTNRLAPVIRGEAIDFARWREL